MPTLYVPTLQTKGEIDMSELKPCPFCGNTDLYKGAFAYWTVSCKKCPASQKGETEQEAIQAWNTRADGWISVEDELPNEGDYVLVWGNELMPNVCFLAKVSEEIKNLYRKKALRPPPEKIFYDLEHCWQLGITHWQPLPLPPQEK
jgi:Lar family restriction alleviation protein